MREHEAKTLRSGGIAKRQFVIGTSCDTGHHASDSALAAGMDVFLAKPFTPSDLKLLVKPNTNRQLNNRLSVEDPVANDDFSDF